MCDLPPAACAACQRSCAPALWRGPADLNRKDKMDQLTCKDCIYADSQSNPMAIGKPQTFCHRNPPTPALIMGKNGVTQLAAFFPPVMPEMWCGEGMPKPMIN